MGSSALLDGPGNAPRMNKLHLFQFQISISYGLMMVQEEIIMSCSEHSCPESKKARTILWRNLQTAIITLSGPRGPPASVTRSRMPPEMSSQWSGRSLISVSAGSETSKHLWLTTPTNFFLFFLVETDVLQDDCAKMKYVSHTNNSLVLRLNSTKKLSPLSISITTSRLDIRR